jgi:hypothetical protein
MSWAGVGFLKEVFTRGWPLVMADLWPCVAGKVFYLKFDSLIEPARSVPIRSFVQECVYDTKLTSKELTLNQHPIQLRDSIRGNDLREGVSSMPAQPMVARSDIRGNAQCDLSLFKN